MGAIKTREPQCRTERGCRVWIWAMVFTVLFGVGACARRLTGAYIDLQEERSRRIEFNALLWQLNDEFELDPGGDSRVFMIDDLLDSGQLDGLTRDEVLQLLGTAMEEYHPRGISENSMCYYLGAKPSWLSHDWEYLIVELDAEGVVSRCWVHVDWD